MIGGYVFDAGTGGYKDVMITFVTLTLVTIVAATLVPIGITAKAYQEPDEPRWVFFSCNFLVLWGFPDRVHIAGDFFTEAHCYGGV